MAKYDCFLTHDWGTDEMDRDNHERVSRCNAMLKEAGISTWFDEESLHGDINAKMAEGIESSACVIVFITRRYMNKANGMGPNGADDNCKFELDLALRRKGVGRMVVVVMEPSMRSTNQWTGTVGGKLGGQLYTDLSNDGVAFEAGVQNVIKEVRNIASGGAAPAHAGSGAGAAPPHPTPKLTPSKPAPETVTMSGQPMFLMGWNGPFKLQPHTKNGRPVYRRAGVSVGLIPIIDVEIWYEPDLKCWVLHRDPDGPQKFVKRSMHSNETPIGPWEGSVKVSA